MAENEQDEPIDDKEEELLTDEDGSEEKKKRFSKPLLIKIAIGVVILLLVAGGAYFFLMTDDEQLDETLTKDLVETEVAVDNVEGEPESGVEAGTDSGLDKSGESTSEEGIDTDNLIDIPAGGAPESNPEALTNSQKLDLIREDIQALQEENSRLKQQVTGEEVSENIEADTNGKEELKEGGEAAKDKPKSNQYSDIYKQEKEYPYARKPKQEPVPEPKWGE